VSWILFGDKGSGAFAAEAALAEAGARCDFREISLQRNEQRSPEFLAVNPAGKIPALQLPEGEVITETLAMLLTIAERYPAAGLLPPPGTQARAQACRWLAFMASEIYPIVEIEDYPSRFVLEGVQSVFPPATSMRRCSAVGARPMAGAMNISRSSARSCAGSQPGRHWRRSGRNFSPGLSDHIYLTSVSSSGRSSLRP